jgi:phage N-6-adenine-methyltransferase
MTADADVRETPPALFKAQDARFHFTLDACATYTNTKCDRFFGYGAGGIFTDGLTGSWAGERVWCNPPYSDIGAWLMKAWESQAESVCMLVPATRTEQAWWQDGVEPFRDGKAEDLTELGWTSLQVEFLRERQHFLEDGHPIWRKNKDGSLWLNAKGEKQRSSPKFGCCLLIWT